MGQGKKKLDSKDIVFKRLFGVLPETLDKMTVVLQKEFNKLHRSGGSPPKLSVEDKLTITLKYLREYRTMESIGADYGVSKSTVCETIQWVEDTLAKDKTFKLPGKKVLKKAEDAIQYIVVDVTESPIQRPKKGKKSIILEKKASYDKNSGNHRREKQEGFRCE
jgi:hypothetical protein